MRPAALVGVWHVAPWDWPILAWSLPAWLDVVDRAILTWPYLTWLGRDGGALAWSREAPTAIGEARAAFWRALPRTRAKWVTDLPLPQPEPFTEAERAHHMSLVEAPRRNAVSWLVPRGALIVCPDCDERPQSPAALRAALERVDMGESLALRAPITDVLGTLPGGRALVVAEPRETRTIAVTRPGCYTTSRSTALSPRDLRAGLIHWRGWDAGPAWREHHDRYLGAGFSDWLAGLREGEQPRPGVWGTDAKGWRRFAAVALDQLGCPVPAGAVQLGGRP